MSTKTDLDPGNIRLYGPKAHRRADIGRAFQDGTITRSIREAATVEIVVLDAAYRLTDTGLLDDDDVWIELDGYGFQLTGSSRAGDLVTLQFTDQVAVELKSRTGHLTWAKGKLRSDFVARMCREAHVACVAQPSPQPTTGVLERASADDPKGEDSWTATGRLADDVGWRRYSDGRRVVFGSDGWLTARQAAFPIHRHKGNVRATPGVVTVEWDIDLGTDEQQATITAALHRWQGVPGQAVHVYDQGPASGVWLIESVSRPYTSLVGTVTLARKTRTLTEAKAAAESGGGGDNGRAASLPGERSNDTGGRGSSRAEAMISWGLKHDGAPYVWGGGHPSPVRGGYDCSGFVSAAVKAAGGHISGTVRTLYAGCQSHGTTCSVATAARTRGALLVALGTGHAGGDHIGISLGDGRTLEARSTKDGIGVWAGGASWSGWNHGATVPGF